MARAAPGARAGGNIRPRGAAHDPGASRRSIFVTMPRARMRRENEKRLPPPPAIAGGRMPLRAVTRHVFIQPQLTEGAPRCRRLKRR